MAPTPDDINANNSAALCEIVAECLERMETEGPAALEAICATHPQWSNRIREAVGSVVATGLVEDLEGATGWMPEELGDYKLLRRIGDGGMGIVFLAQQRKLGRRVAVKLIRPDQLDHGESKVRLMREVQAVASLSHPAIVSVFDIGEENGLPFYSMEFVRGCTLADLVGEFRGRDPGSLRGDDVLQAVIRSAERSAADVEDDRPIPRVPDQGGGERMFAGSWYRVCLRVVEQVAQALHHAHEHGIVHRDIKPSNIMLTPAGRVVLLDFGLAQVHGSDKITRTGAAVGSVAYMSPEQIQRSAVDPRTDVYSLGVTLYEALTLRAPFLGESFGEVQWAILAGSPSAPRALARTIPLDAETVCLTAMDRDQERRYTSAEAMARDVRAVLELQPIVARRASRLLRARRWMQRHRALTIATGLAALLAVGVPTLLWWQGSIASQRVSAAEQRSDSTLGEMDDLIDSFRSQVNSGALRSLAGSAEVREQMVADLSESFERLRTVHSQSSELLRRGMQMQQEFAKVYNEVSSQELRLKAHRATLDLASDLVHLRAQQDDGEAPTGEGTTSPEGPPPPWTHVGGQDRGLVGSAWYGVASSLYSLNRVAEAQVEAEACMGWLSDAQPDDQTLQVQFSLAVMLGQAANRADQHTDRDRWINEAIARLEGAPQADTPAFRSCIGHLYTERGNYAEQVRDTQSAQAAFLSAMHHHDAAVRSDPDNEAFLMRRAGAERAYGSLLQTTGRAEEARDYLTRSCEDWRELCRVCPDDVGYASELGGGLHNLAQGDLARGDHRAAIELLDEAIARQRWAHSLRPQSRGIQQFLSNHLAVFVIAHVGAGTDVDLDPVVKEIASLQGDGQGALMAAFCVAVRYGACTETEEQDSLAAQGLAYLEAARDEGVKQIGLLGSPGFRALLDRPEFADVQEDLRR